MPSHGKGHGNSLQYSCLENPLDRGACRVTFHGGRKESDTTEVRHMHTHITAIFDFNPNYAMDINPH